MCREKGGGESYLQSGQTHFTSDKCLFEGEKRKEKQGGRKEGNGKKKRQKETEGGRENRKKITVFYSVTIISLYIEIKIKI